MKFLLPSGTAVLASVLAAGCVVHVDSQGHIIREDRKFTTAGTPELTLNTFDGSIEIRAWDRRDVLVEIEKRGSSREAVQSTEVKATQEGNRIDIEVRRPREETFTGLFHQSTSARFIVSVPQRADIVARSGDGSIRIEGVTGRIELRTGDGSIRAAAIGGDITLNTGDGSVDVDGAEGRLALETGDGGVTVSGKLTAVKMHTGDGSIVYRAQPGTIMAEPWDISTGDGTVALFLPREFGADLDAHTGDGVIRNELEVETVEAGEVSRRTVRGRLGSGGKLLRIRTGDGSIRLRAS